MVIIISKKVIVQPFFSQPFNNVCFHDDQPLWFCTKIYQFDDALIVWKLYLVRGFPSLVCLRVLGSGRPVPVSPGSCQPSWLFQGFSQPDSASCWSAGQMTGGTTECPGIKASYTTQVVNQFWSQKQFWVLGLALWNLWTPWKPLEALGKSGKFPGSSWWLRKWFEKLIL